MTERATKRRKTAADDDAANRDSSPSISDTSSVSGTGSSTPPSSPPSTPPPSESLSRTKYTHADLVTLLIGPDEQKSLVFGHQLSEHSEFFKSALKNEWVEGQTRTIRLPEDHASQITQYLDFVHGHGLPTKHVDTFAALDEFDLPGEDKSYGSLFELYIFGERVIDKNLQNATIKEVVRLTSLVDDAGAIWMPSEGTKCPAYKGTTSDSPARRLLADMRINLRPSIDLDLELPIDYIRDVARAFNAKLDAGSKYTSH
jgi:hypothetical protein